MGIRKHRIYKDLPVVTPITTTKILVTDETTGLMGFAAVSALQTTVDGAGLATDASVNALTASIAALSASIGVSGSYSTQAIFYATDNGNGTNFKVGDDAWIGDVNTVNTIQVSGVQNADRGYIKFGSGSTTPTLGYGGSNYHLTLGGALALTPQATLGIAPTGSLAVSGSHLYFFNGAWTQII
jgi:hypothetical protein